MCFWATIRIAMVAHGHQDFLYQYSRLVDYNQQIIGATKLMILYTKDIQSSMIVHHLSSKPPPPKRMILVD
jgi:hypothetical protein